MSETDRMALHDITGKVGRLEALCESAHLRIDEIQARIQEEDEKKRAGQRWLIGTALSVIGLFMTAVGLLWKAIGL